jgi:2,3-bisphosphoglycerate-independent phosphoglycerate mutase
MMLEEGQVYTAHSLAGVPFIDVTPVRRPLRIDGVLGDIAPTILEVMGLPKPAEMTCRTLFEQCD